MRSTMRATMLFVSPGTSRRSFSSGKSGVRSSKRGRVRASSGVMGLAVAPVTVASAPAAAAPVPGLGHAAVRLLVPATALAFLVLRLRLLLLRLGLGLRLRRLLLGGGLRRRIGGRFDCRRRFARRLVALGFGGRRDLRGGLTVGGAVLGLG